MGMKVVDLRPTPACPKTYRIFSYFAKILIFHMKREEKSSIINLQRANLAVNSCLDQFFFKIISP